MLEVQNNINLMNQFNETIYFDGYAYVISTELKHSYFKRKEIITPIKIVKYKATYIGEMCRVLLLYTDNDHYHKIFMNDNMIMVTSTDLNELKNKYDRSMNELLKSEYRGKLLYHMSMVDEYKEKLEKLEV